MDVMITIDLNNIGPMWIGECDGKKVLRFVASDGKHNSSDAEPVALKAISARIRFKKVQGIPEQMTTQQLAKFLGFGNVRALKRFAKKHGVGASNKQGSESVYNKTSITKLMLAADTAK